MRAPRGVASPPASTSPDPVPYLDDASYRRAQLETSIVNPQNGYSQLRLEHYATGTTGDWDLLPEWNPATDPIAAAELDAPGGATTTAFASPHAPFHPHVGHLRVRPEPRRTRTRSVLALSGAAGSVRERGARVARGRVAVRMWTDSSRGVGGLVRAQMADGSPAVAVTCASCHAAPAATGIEDGLPNAQLDLGAAILASPNAATDPAAFAAIAAWGPGRLDVTTAEGNYPERIPDLRPVAWLTYLHQEGTLRQQGPTALAIRIETLVIVSNGQVLRPPRMIALALAAYVTSLAEALPLASAAATAEPRGAQVFETSCASCHAPDGFTGEPVPLAVVGTDPWLGGSPDRGTGMYRVPSLHGVGTRGPLLHDGTIPSIAALLDPTRPTAAFTGRLHGAGAVPGHLYGLDLSDADRAALIAYLEAL